MIKISTGLRDLMLATKSLKKALDGGVIQYYQSSGGIPATADDPVTGTLLCTITDSSATTNTAKKKITITPTTAGTTGTWTVAINGLAVTFTDDGSPTVAEVCAGLSAAINVVMGQADGTTPKFKVSAGGEYGAVVAVDGATSFTVEAVSAGTLFDYSVAATGAGNSLAAVITLAAAYGLLFEADADATAGIVEKLASQTWSGKAAATGTVDYFRFVTYGDAGSSSTTLPRIQGNVATSGSDLNISSTAIAALATQTIDTFPITLPAYA